MRALAFLVLTFLPVEAQQFTTTEISRHVLTNEGVAALAKAGFDELFIIGCIKTSRIQFDTTIEGLIALKKAGVNEDLISVMVSQDNIKRDAIAASTDNHAGKQRTQNVCWGLCWVRKTTSQ